MLTLSTMPKSRLGWHEHFAERFNKTNDPRAEHLACWYLFLHLAFDRKTK